MGSEALRLPLAVQPSNRDLTATATSKDAKIVNAYLTPDLDTQELIVCKRPGIWSLGNDSTAVANYGVFNWKESIYSYSSNGTTLRVYNLANVGPGQSVSLIDKGAAAGLSGKTSFTPCYLGANNRLYISGSGGGFVFDGTTLTAPSGANYPGAQLGTAAWLDGTLYVPATNYIYGSDFGDPTAFSDTTNRILVQTRGLPLTGIIGYQNYILAFSSYSMDAYWDAGNPTGSPLQLVQGSHLDTGAAMNTMVQIEDRLLWVGRSLNGPFRVYMMSGLKPTVISTPAVDRLLSALANSSISGFSVVFMGHRFYVLTYSTSGAHTTQNITLAYDIDLQKWYQWAWYDGNCFPIISSTNISSSLTVGSGLIVDTIMAGYDGNFYTFNSQAYTDSGGDFAVDIVTPNLDAKTRFIKALPRLDLNGDQVTNSTVQMRWSDDDYQTWSDYTNLDMGADVASFKGLGSFTKRSFHFHHKQNLPLRLRSADIYPDKGTS